MPNRVPSSSPSVIDGITLSRTLVPTLPTNFLSRKHLFTLFSEKRPGATLLVAPAGYGKSSLVAEWVAQSESKVIWTQLSKQDTYESLAKHMVQSARNVIQNFAPWATNIAKDSAEESIRQLSNELIGLDQDFIWVLDNAEDLPDFFIETTRVFLESIPNNLHLVVISRTAPEASYSRFATLGNLNLITPQDLLFSGEEVETIAMLSNLDYSNLNIRHTLESAHGWPAAVQLLVRKLQSGKIEFTMQDALASQTDPLSYLAEAILDSIKSEDLELITYLSAVDEFDSEIAELLLGQSSTPQFFARMTADGLFTSLHSDTKRTYQLNPILRESLQNRFLNSKTNQLVTHKKLAAYFLEHKKIGLALSHAHLSGDESLLQAILKNNIRTIAATGNGDFLIQWSKIIGDKSSSGHVRRLSLRIAAHVVNLQFEQAQALINELLFLIKESGLKDFLEKSANVSSATISFANGNLLKLKSEIDFVLKPVGDNRDVENIDKLHVMRLFSNQALALEDYDECIKIYSRAQELLTADYAPLPMYYLNAISAAASFAEGNYFEAFDIASTGIATAEMNNYSGIAGPIDLHYIRARCLVEFSRSSEAMTAFELVRSLSLSAKQKVWYILADGYLLRQMILDSKVEQAFEGIKNQRELLQSVTGVNQLDALVDANEAFLRYIVKDYDRVLLLLDRMPDGHFVSRFKPIVLERQGKKVPDSYSTSIPENTPREKIYKHISVADSVIDREKEALGHLRKALDLAALYGARETILRQSPQILNLIIKASGERPTVYLEELARAAATRLKFQDQNRSGISEALTKREIEILKNLSTGKPISAIGSSLHVSQNTMKTHLRNIYRKLEADGRHSAVEKAKSLFII
jgi:ATP/maltotriose-dependent transcriptional regulator MalT